jgi:signal transduction histidine kinase
LKKADLLKNQLYEKEKYAKANQIAAKYQTREKDKEIKQLEEGYELMDFKLTQRTRFFIILSTILAMGAFSAFNYYRLQKHRYDTERLIADQKEEISNQKINELENTMKIKNLESMVQGQEAERSRIAAELHDSLGGTLSALKLQYDTLQLDHHSLSEDYDYNRILGLIDDACRDVRDISRNLKPIALENLGLTAALKDLVNRYSTRGKMDISLHLHNVDGILDTEAKLHVYRIIQELLTNAIRHANATEIDIQINKTNDELVIIIEDNGKGFVLDQVKKGLGLGNLDSRINVLHGNIEVDSRVDYGTSFIVRIPIKICESAA